MAMHVLVAIVFGGTVGYHLAMPMNLGSLIVPLLALLLGILACACIELANCVPLPPRTAKLGQC